MHTTIENSNGSPFKRRTDRNIMDVSRQWMTRPADEAVFSVEDLLTRTARSHEESSEVDGIPWDQLHVMATDDGALALRGAANPVYLTHFSGKQLCTLPAGDDDQKCGGIAPHNFITKLSAETAAVVLNERIRKGVRRKSDAQLLVREGLTRNTLRSVTTEKYERVWDHELALRIADLCDKGTWGKAEAFRRAGGKPEVRHAFGETSPPPLGWVGDRSMYVCLVDYEGSVEHNGNQYARFFLLSNSEVGAASLKVTFGLMDFACCNFILWGCHEVYEANFAHVGNVRDKWAELSQGFTHHLAADTRQNILDGMNLASKTILGDKKEEVIARVQKITTLPKTLVTDAYARAERTSRYGDPASVWGMLNGLTEASQHAAQNADRRTLIDAKAAQLMTAM